MKNASYWVTAFDLKPHPEGGFFAETYRAAETIPQSALSTRFPGDRSFSTAIYFLLESHHTSVLHRIRADEVWHFYAGYALEVFVIDPLGVLTVIRLGNNPDRGEVFQATVPAGCWFGAKTAAVTETVSTAGEPVYALVGCTVAPGFDFADFELADPDALRTAFPQHTAVIDRLSRS